MSIHRRQFLAAAGLSLSAPMMAIAAAPITDPPDWAAVRDQFEISRDYIHLSSFFIASHPRPVREAIEKHRRAIEDNPFLYVEKNIFEMPVKVRTVAAEYMEARVEEVALTNSTTMGLGFIYQGLPLKAGDEVLMTAHDHFVHHECIRLAASRAGASVRKIALYEDAMPITEEEILDRIVKAVAPKTRALGITWVHSGTGMKLPVRRIADAIAGINAGRGEADRIHQLNEQCKEGLAKMPHIRLITPRGSHLSAGIICFDVKSMKPEQAVERLLARRILASQSPYAASYVRVAPSLLNSPEEVETTLREIRALAALKG